MRRPARRLAVRTRLLLTVAGALAVALAASIFAFDTVLGHRLSGSATALAQSQARAELTGLSVVGGALVPPEAPDDGSAGNTVWIFASGRAVEAPRTDAETGRAAVSLAGGPEQSLTVRGRTRLYAVPVVRNGRRIGTVVAAVALKPYEESRRAARVGSAVLAAALLAAVVLLTRWILAGALLPVSRMTRDAATWSEHDLDRRFALGEPYDELTRLAETLDGLLDRLAASTRRERQLLAELSHELRTPLARVATEAELALRRDRSPVEYRESLEAVARSTDQMTRTVEALLAAARQEAAPAGRASDAGEALGRVVAATRQAAAARGTELRLSLPAEPVQVRADADLVERAVQPLVDNAIRYCTSVVAVELVSLNGWATINVVDDGPGVTDEEHQRIFTPGVRGTAGGGVAGGAGLGLALAQRLARSCGGDITARASTAGGQFTLRLPAA